jgi:putative ABC transport system permease protein
MRILAMLRSLWRTLVMRGREEESLDDELRAYVELLTAEHDRAGMAPDEARRRALIETGGVEQVKEATREAWTGQRVATFIREIRFTLRALWNAPGFSLVTVTILAIAIGGSTAIFTVIKGSLLRPLPAVSHPEELVSLEPSRGETLLYDFSYLDYLDLREQSQTLAGLAGYDGTSMTLEDAQGRRGAAWVSYVTGDFFSVLGVRPAAGRLIGPADESDATHVVVLAHDLWQERYGGDPEVIGSTVRLAGRPLTVIGVAPPRFIGAMLVHPMELWVPATTLPTLVTVPGMLDSRDGRFLRLVGRLSAGRTLADAQRELAALGARLADSYPADEGRGIRVFPGTGMTVEERTALARLPRLLAAAVGLLLVIACANVASLSLVRAAARRRELATRLALGASRRTLFGRMVLEGGVLAACGGALGIALALLLVRAQTIVQTIAGMPPRVGVDVTLDRRVLLVALGVSVLTALTVSIAPVLQVMRVTPSTVLRDGAAGAGPRRRLVQRGLVVAQVAASLVLLASAAIVFSTFRRVLTTDPGFDPTGLAAASAAFDEAQLDSAQAAAYRDEWLSRAARDPAVAGAALASVVPPAPWLRPGWIFRAGEQPPPGAALDDSPAGGTRGYLNVVSPGFFDVLRLPIVRGRGFLASDNEGGEPVVVVSQRLADDLWPGESALGETLSLPAQGTRPRPAMRVVGVAGDVQFASVFDAPPAVAYLPAAQHAGSDLLLIVRSRTGGPGPDATIRGLGNAIDARVPMRTVVVADRIDDQVRPQRIASAWIGVFGALALVLAAIGLYGVVAQGVLHRTRELAVRSTLGATPRGLVSLVVGEGMRVAALGTAMGVAAGWAALRILQSQFDGVAVGDVRGAVVAVAIVGAAMLAASWLPARRAARLHPAEVLRCD